MLAAAACVLACACGGDEKKSEEAENTCPPAVSYETVGAPFLEQHCLRCHGSDVGERLGGGHVFDSEAALAEHGRAAHDNVTSGRMPKDRRPVPSADKAAFLAWLACAGFADGHGDHTH